MLFLSGCASGLRPEAMVYAPPADQDLRFAPAYVGGLAIGDVSGEMASPPAWAPAFRPESFEDALRRSLSRQGLLSESGPYRVHVRLDRLEQPALGGLDLTVRLHANYTLTEVSSGKRVFHEDIRSFHTATMGDSLVFGTRLQMAHEGAVRENIRVFMEKLGERPVLAAEKGGKPASVAQPLSGPRPAVTAAVASKPVSASLSVSSRKLPKAARPNPHAVAVVIGNQRYGAQGKGVVDVAYAEQDAAMMKACLVRTFGYDEKNILYYANATGSDLREIFGTRENPAGMLRNYIRDGQSDVFVYYSGHGAPGPEGRAAYLVPVDARPDFIAHNGYPLDLLYGNLEKLPAKSLTVVLDACFSGESGGGALFTNISAMMRHVPGVREVKNGLIFSSTDKGQVATWYQEKGHSLFTWYFLEGLSGAADANRDGRITADELRRYLQNEVPHRARRESNRIQTPQMRGDPGRVMVILK